MERRKSLRVKSYKELTEEELSTVEVCGFPLVEDDSDPPQENQASDIRQVQSQQPNLVQQQS